MSLPQRRSKAAAATALSEPYYVQCRRSHTALRSNKLRTECLSTIPASPKRLCHTHCGNVGCEFVELQTLREARNTNYTSRHGCSLRNAVSDVRHLSLNLDREDDRCVFNGPTFWKRRHA